MVAHYKIMATIIKPGCLPTQWIRYSERRMTEVVCQKMFSLLIAGRIPDGQISRQPVGTSGI
ncbi:DUF1187 family protein [Escherichia coli]|nr:DUF1187 family protein [Escherichia coli]EEY8760269.1 DUF1187 family protein [Escherichia coli]EFD5342973.1 DUF1187 family protein [Escherichia coli]EFH5765120.1 DUF1187 family protein [Escherichia coli]EFI7423494.1 DUF1187 family protein [Escherichia coli]EFJ2737226.1 DUF1187 family protein [Escherichia coli]